MSGVLDIPFAKHSPLPFSICILLLTPMIVAGKNGTTGEKDFENWKTKEFRSNEKIERFDQEIT